VKALVIALVIALAAPAYASHCHETTPVVGLAHCRRFGWWSHVASLGFEVGAVALRFDPGAISTDAYGTHADGTLATYHVAGAGPVSAMGVRVREMLSWGRHFHVGSEADMAAIVDGPALVVADTTARTDAMTMRGGGSLGVAKLIIGEHVAVGGLALGGELAPGLRIATYTLDQLPPDVKGPAQAAFVLEAHARAELWLSPQISLAGEAGVNVLAQRDVTLGIALAVHLIPYDGAR
jgi:hypothetical protein